MTLEQLRIFVAVAEREHVTAAARAMNLTQSAVSNALAALEERHAVQLFDRVGRGIVLNENGRQFLDEARAVLARAGLADAVLADLAGLRRGRLAVFASQTIAGYWLPERLVRFHARHPAVELDIRVGNTSEVAAAVLEGTAELGFVEGSVTHPLLDGREVGQDRLVVLVPWAHPWAGATALGRADLEGAAWVMREQGSGTRSSLEQALAALGCDVARLDVTMSLPSNEAVLQAVESGAGAAGLSAHVARGSREAGRLVAAALELPTRSFRMLWHRERHRTRAASAFADEVTPPSP